MCCHRYRGIGLFIAGFLICAGSFACHFYGCGVHGRGFHSYGHRAQMEQHIAEVCVKAAQQVQK